MSASSAGSGTTTPKLASLRSANRLWKDDKKLSGMSSVVRDSDELMRSLHHISEESLSAWDLANLINDTFLSSMQDFTSLSAETFQLPQDYSTAQPFAVTAYVVYL